MHTHTHTQSLLKCSLNRNNPKLKKTAKTENELSTHCFMDVRTRGRAALWSNGAQRKGMTYGVTGQCGWLSNALC